MISVRLDKDIEVKLNLLSKQLKKSKSKIIKEALKEYISKQDLDMKRVLERLENISKKVSKVDKNIDILKIENEVNCDIF